MLFLEGKSILFVFNESSGAANRHWFEFLTIESTLTSGSNRDLIATQYPQQLARNPPAKADIDTNSGHRQDIDFGGTDSERQCQNIIHIGANIGIQDDRDHKRLQIDAGEN
jgi:hypothetical protein